MTYMSIQRRLLTPYRAKRGIFRGLFGALADERNRIDPLAVAQHFEVQVRARCTTRIPHQRDCLTFSDFFTDRDEVFRVMRIAGRITVAMIYFEQFAETVTR